MRLTFTVLFACWTIYSGSSAVLSLPPSLIASAASLQQQHQQQQEQEQHIENVQEQPNATTNLNRQWHKDAAASKRKHKREHKNDDDGGVDGVGKGKAKGEVKGEGGNTFTDTISSSSSSSSSSHATTTDNTSNRYKIENKSENKNTNNLAEKNKYKASNRMHTRISRMAEMKQMLPSAAIDVPIDPRSVGGAYDLNGFLQATAANDDDDVDGLDNDEERIHNDDVAAAAAAAFGAVPDESTDRINTDDVSLQSREAQLTLPVNSASVARANTNEFFTPLKYWARHCQPNKNCPKQYYRALFADRPTESGTQFMRHPNRLKAENMKTKNLERFGDGEANNEFYDGNTNMHNIGNIETYDDVADIANNYAKDQKLSDDIFMFLNGEQDVIKFLRWAMQLLYPHERLTNYSATGADYYHPGMYIWKKLNLSGHLEPPLFVEEPHYIIVRREQLNGDYKPKSNYNNDDPFIPPRGRKHNMPDLDALLHRYETFVPNRGRRDKIKDMLKSNDLFFPNRGKRQKSISAATARATSVPPTPMAVAMAVKRDLEYENGSINGKSDSDTDSNIAENNSKTDVVNIENESSYNDDNWNTALPLALIMRDMLAKLWQMELQKQQIAAGNKITKNAHEINNENNYNNHYNNNNYENKNNPEWLQAMLNYKFNDDDRSGIKQSMPMAMAINGETREMSTPTATALATRKNADTLMLQMHKMHANIDAAIANDDVGDDNDRNDNNVDNDFSEAFYNDDNDDNDNDSLVVVGDVGDNDDLVNDVGALIGVDGARAKIGANRLFSTRSMSTAMTHRRQQQQQRKTRQQQEKQKKQNQMKNLRRLAALSMELKPNTNIEIENEKVNKWQQVQRHQKSPTTDQRQQRNEQNVRAEPLSWRHALIQHKRKQQEQQQQEQQQRYQQPRFWPQEALRYSLVARAHNGGPRNAAHVANYNFEY